MHIAIAHNAVAQRSTPDELDVIVQVESVQSALYRLGYATSVVAVDLDLSAVSHRISAIKPNLVFNLVESLAGSGRLIHCFPALLDALGVAYTGASAEALFFTSNKVLAKERLHLAGLSTPMWVGGESGKTEALPDSSVWPHQWIIKSVWEHASIGLDETALIRGSQTLHLPALMGQRAASLGGNCFAEAFIDGREFNLSVIDGENGPSVLPPAEIVFEGFGQDKPRIVDYNAKWEPDSYAFHHTPRCFEFADRDADLISQLTASALKCWDLFHLRGYARVDFRVDNENRPWILEVNANPCISPDAGFAAAVAQSAMAYDAAIERIVAAVKTE